MKIYVIAMLLSLAAWAGGGKGSGWSDDGEVYCGPVTTQGPDGGVTSCEADPDPRCVRHRRICRELPREDPTEVLP